MAGAQLHYRIEQLECQLDEANLKLEEFGQSAPPTDPAKDQALSVSWRGSGGVRVRWRPEAAAVLEPGW